MHDDVKRKPRRKGSPLAQDMIEAAAHSMMATRYKNDPAYAAYSEREAAKLMLEPRKRLTGKMVEGVGVGGEMILNTPSQLGSAEGLQLRDTVKEPNAVTATAQLERLRLAEDAGALDIALDTADTIQPRNSLEKMLSHQLAALHAFAMRMAGTAGSWLDHAKPDHFHDNATKQMAMVEAARGATAVAKMMQAYQQGLLTLQRIRSGGQKVTVVHQHVQVAGGHVAVAGAVNQRGGKHGGE